MFNFKNENDEIMEINLTYNKLDQSCFAIDSLINFKRPTKLILLKNQIKYLIEEIFKPFLNANKLNTIEIDEQYFDLNDQRNQWIKDINFQGIHIK